MAVVYLNSVTGNDSNTYSQAQSSATPWLTLAKVLASATTGDTVILSAGTYTFATGSWTKAFTWTGAALSSGLPTTIFDLGSGIPKWTLTANQTFTNIFFKNYIASTGAANPGDNCAFYVATTGITLTFTNCAGYNIQPYANAFGDGGFIGYEINTSFDAGAVAMTGCTFYGIKKYSGGTYSPLICIKGVTAMTITMNNNTFYASDGGANQMRELVLRGAGTVTLTGKNNIVANFAGGTMYFTTGTITVAETYSDHYLITSAPAGTGNITSDPLFVDAANANFNTRPTSPCRGTGVVI